MRPVFVCKFDVDRITLRAAFGNDRFQHARRVAGAADGHRDAHGGAAGGVDPRVVGDGPGEAQRRLGVEVVARGRGG